MNPHALPCVFIPNFVLVDRIPHLRSTSVAEWFRRPHGILLEEIEMLRRQFPGEEAMFLTREYGYLMTRHGFALMMPFEQDAIEMKLLYLKAFSAVERANLPDFIARGHLPIEALPAIRDACTLRLNPLPPQEKAH